MLREDVSEKTKLKKEFAMELELICDYLQVEMPGLPRELKDFEAIMDFVMNENGMMRRKITLTKGWWKEGAMPLLCQDDEGRTIAMIPSKSGGYWYYKDGEQKALNKKEALKFSSDAYGFYKPMLQRSMTVKEFLFFMLKAFTPSDITWLLSVSLVTALLGMIMPTINKFIFHSVIPSGTSEQLAGICVLLFGTIVVTSIFKLARSIWVLRIGNKLELLAQNAVWARLLSLPVKFFKRYDSGELTQRAVAINQICEVLGGQMIPTVLASVFSVVYLVQIYTICSQMFLPSLLIVIAIVVTYIVTAVLAVKESKHNNEVDGKLYGLVFQLLNGIAKIKMAGAQDKAFGKWAEEFRKLKIIPSRFLILSEAINRFLVFGGTIVLYISAYLADMSVSDYIAFNAAFALFLGAIMSMADVIDQLSSLKPAMDMLRPIIEEEPENSGYKTQVTGLSGDIELNRVRFRYNENMPYVLDDLNLSIKKGDYIGIVGSSGCGKSTLMKILLGFEKAESGSVYYDLQDIEGLDIKSVRRRIGVVLQHGKLFAGDIYSNIVVCAPWLTVEDAWKAAERSGFAEDIEKMPMGMYTIISEGGGGLSGGQRQRLLIARALAVEPDIVMFDEATSALDNVTQALVVKTLEEMDCTRLVIAHRLSTIKNCTRIIYMHEGKIAEEGTFDELMQLNGKFAKLAERQMV